MGLLDTNRSSELARQGLTGDDKFYKQFLYFFELRIPPAGTRTGIGTFAIFPLLLNPQQYSISDPFTLEVTPTLGGGLWVEENGVLMRNIRIAGTTGFKPRSGAADRGWGAFTAKTERTSFPLRGDAAAAYASAISGQRQLQLIQDRVFRLYGDLKRNPETSEGTQLLWHNPKDSEHWLVVPRGFTLQRAAPRSTEYFYTIDLLAVDKGETIHPVPFVSEDTSLLTRIKNFAKAIRDAIDTVRGIVENVTQLINDIEDAVRSVSNAIRSVVDLVNDVVNLIDKAADFVSGVADFISAPFSVVKDLVDGFSQVTDQIENLVVAGRADIPAGIVQELVGIRRGVESLSLFGDRFETKMERRLDQISANARVLITGEEAAAVDAPSTFTQYQSLGTGPNRGSALVDRGRGQPEAPPSRSASAFERTVGQNDTIFTLAQRFLGDSGRYREIAALNNLDPPYVTVAGLPRTLRPGDKVLIPTDRAVRTASPRTVVGASRDTPTLERFFGADFRLDPASANTGDRAFFDLVLNDKGDDLKMVRGIDCLVQGVRTRLTTERGESALYSQLGHPRLISTPLAAVDREVAMLYMTEAVQADDRITDITALRLGNQTDDSVEIEVDAVVYGLEDRVTIQPKLAR